MARLAVAIDSRLANQSHVMKLSGNPRQTLNEIPSIQYVIGFSFHIA